MAIPNVILTMGAMGVMHRPTCGETAISTEKRVMMDLVALKQVTNESLTPYEAHNSHARRRQVHRLRLRFPALERPSYLIHLRLRQHDQPSILSVTRLQADLSLHREHWV